MALRTLTLTLAVLALTFVTACAQKTARVETPKQPDPTEVVEEKEPLATKLLVPLPDESLRDFLKRKEKHEEETRQARYRANEDRELEKIVKSDREQEIDVRAEAIEEEYANRRAQKVVNRADSPAERMARRDRERLEKDAANRDKYAFEAIRNTGLMCSNPGEEEDAWINPTIARTYQFRSHSRVTVTNMTDSPVSIRRVSGRDSAVVVRNLCPGGSMTLWEVLESWVMDNMIVAYAAMTSTGKMSYSPQVWVNRCYGNGCQKEFVAVWEIRP